MLHLDGHWIWDFWIVDDGPARHLFFLKAPRSLGDPDLRHRNARVGHAVSTDLRTWDVLPDALGPGAPGSWDDQAPWTGSVVRGDDRWLLLYTGTSTAEHGTVQRIGMAASDDLVTWRRHPANPLIVADGRWYARGGPEEAWRDPWVLRPPGLTGALAFITARGLDGSGVIASAHSPDLVHWRVGPPVFAPGEFAQLEVPQVVRIGVRWYLIFSVPAASHLPSWSERTGRAPRTATYYVDAPEPAGPYEGHPRPIDAGPRSDELYAGKVVRDGDGLAFLAARLGRHDGGFAGELIDPLPLRAQADGQLAIG